jgi:hypothetical protein
MLVQYPSLLDKAKFDKAAKHKAKRKAKKRKVERLEYQIEHGLGKWCMVKTMTGICPFNMGGNTTYLVGSGITCHAQKSKSGWWLYLTASYNIKDSKHIEQLIQEKRIKRRVSARSHELSFLQPLPDFK